MKAFFKTLGLGIIYTITFPFLLGYLIIYGLYFLVKNFIMTIIILIRLITRKRAFKEFREDKKADDILKANEFEAEQTETITPHPVNYNTTNQVYLSASDMSAVQSLLKKLNENENLSSNISNEKINYKPSSIAYNRDEEVNERSSFNEEEEEKNSFRDQSTLTREDD